MDRKKIASCVINSIENYAGRENLKESDLLFDGLLFDDIDLLEIVIELEKKFEITITDEDVDSFKSVSDIINHIERKIS